ncbi:hypothetical protein [Kitasatospora sp. NPDC093102]|uniref:hypothetical protein n=1 Tax=Kitasatospora sp. NPDC093102 TaxID=3155069 RepID=UPI0034295ACE
MAAVLAGTSGAVADDLDVHVVNSFGIGVPAGICHDVNVLAIPFDVLPSANITCTATNDPHLHPGTGSVRCAPGRSAVRTALTPKPSPVFLL